ncbi:MAG: Dam family site-specific DNA-(adenine-N6)-methyltransferase [Gammaproteobacteria bacterium]
MNSPKRKPFLKWPGGKYRVLPSLLPHFKPGARLIEPFLGAGAVFLNTDYKRYLLADTNPDLIGLYQQLAEEGEGFIRYCRRFFTAEHNCEDGFYTLRDKFNRSNSRRRRAALFIYLNRHCFNGLCRYNSSGKFNAPFGCYSRPYFPLKEMQQFIRHADRAEFLQAGFTATMRQARRGDVIYCDPPYVPLSSTAAFTEYHAGGFDWADQTLLTETARHIAERGVQVLISNHDTRKIRALYRQAGAAIHGFAVRRSISANGANREQVNELLAVFE